MSAFRRFLTRCTLTSDVPPSLRKDEDPTNRPSNGDAGNPTVNFHGEKRSNETHCSTTDPESRLMRKVAGKEAKLSYGANALMENRNGLLVDIKVTPATGASERESAEDMLKRQARKGIKPKTLRRRQGLRHQRFCQDA